MNLVKLAHEKARNKGTSKSALRRRAERERGVIYNRAPGGIFRMSDGERYQVAKDGSIRHVTEVQA